MGQVPLLMTRQSEGPGRQAGALVLAASLERREEGSSATNDQANPVRPLKINTGPSNAAVVCGFARHAHNRSSAGSATECERRCVTVTGCPSGSRSAREAEGELTMLPSNYLCASSAEMKARRLRMRANSRKGRRLGRFASWSLNQLKRGLDIAKP